MISLFCLGVALGVVLRPVFGAPSRRFLKNDTSINGMSLLSASLFARDDVIDVTDHSDILRMAAIGDSYSAGIGAGSKLGGITDVNAYRCSRYDHSYPSLIHNDPALGDPNTRKFQFESCSGALAKEVTEKQVPSINYNQQVILLSAGGNDVGLTNILNSCVYQFASFTVSQVLILELQSLHEDWKWLADFDWETMGFSCDAQLDRSQKIIDSAEFSATLDSLLYAAKNKLALQGGMIYYTGYAKFWAETLSYECDFVSWTSWLNYVDGGRDPVYLTIAHRRRMNDLVDAVNAKIQAAVERAGPEVTFVEYDSYVGRFGGRFCENGVDESKVESGSRSRLMFYEFNTFDPLGNAPWKRSERTAGDGTFKGDMAELAQVYLALNPDAKLNYQEPANAAKLSQAQSAAAAVEVSDILPDGYGRSFHPQVLLHQIIASKVIYLMNNNKALANARSAIPETFQFTSCPLPPNSPGQNLCSDSEGVNTPPRDFVQRILPLGASITWGQGSTTGNGYRKVLADKIIAAGGKVNYVGSRQSGTMDDSDVEGTQGAIITGVQRNLENSLPYKPNLVLINAGTNDCTGSIDVANAHLRMGKIVDRIFSAVPGVVVVLSTLIPNTLNPGNVAIYNANLRKMIASRRSIGQKIQLADMQGPNGDGPLVSDLQDGNTHPNDAGFEKMANVWYKSLQEVYKNCWLSPPLDSGISDSGTGGKPDTKCEKTLDNVQGPTLTQRGSDSAKADAPYTHVGVPKGAFKLDATWSNTKVQHDAANVMWADINGDGIDDFVYILTDNTGTAIIFSVQLTNPVANDVIPVGEVVLSIIPSSPACLRAGVKFGDANGDGRDDYFCFSPEGDLYCWLNKPGDTVARPNWVPLGIVMRLPAGRLQKDIRLADIDGDGRVDYVAINQVGLDVIATAWRNNGHGDEIKSFDAIGEVMRVNIAAIGLTENVDVRSYRFVDLNGDGRDDFIVVYGKGAIWTWINHRAYAVGLAPQWDVVGQTSTGNGIDIENLSGLHHAKVRGSTRNDYIHVRDAPKSFIPLIDIYANEGSGGLYLKGDGCRYCDMRGRGADDYIWMRSDGAIHLFGNRNEPPYWDDLGDLPFPYPEWTMNRRDIHLADIDGDGKCDYIWVNPKAPEFTVFINVWTQSGGFKWGPPRIYSAKTNVGVAGSLGLNCNNHYTYNPFDFPVRFADIDGDGRADYLCLDADGRTTAAIADGQGIPIITSAKFLPASYKSVGQIKFSEGADRTSIRFADINGDGRADYIWVGKTDGVVRAWTNGGNIPTSGSSWKWGGAGAIVGYGQISRGENIQFANIKGQGRADLVVVHPDTSVASTYFNVCPGGGKGLMPKLPFLPGCTVC